MTSALAIDRTIVARLRVRGAVDPLAARLRLESMLAVARLRPLCLPPAAILCVRRLRDPLPGALSLRRLDLRPPPAWERALDVALDDLARRAARPADGAVPPSADAIIFADRAELLACLAADLLSGSIAQRWWWARLVDVASSPRAVIDAFLDAPEHAPAALAQLASRSLVAPFLSLFSSDDARALLDRVVERHGLAEIHAALASFDLDPAPVSDSAPSIAPLCARVPDLALPAIAALAPPARALLAVALLLARAPMLARRAAIAAAVAALSRPAAPLAVPRTTSPPEAETPPLSFDLAAPIEAPPAVAPLRSALSRAAAVDLPRAILAPPSPSADRATAPAPAAPRVAILDEAPPVEEDLAVAPAPRAEPSPGAAIVDAPTTSPDLAATPDLAAPFAASLPVTAAEIPRALGASVPTALGGLFFLVNVALYLGLYPDFTRPLDRGLDLSIWDFVTLVGKALLGDDSDPEDPVWPLLAELAGRAPGDPPGVGFEPPDQDEYEYRIPPEWLGPVDLYLEIDGADSAPPAPIPGSALERWLGRLIPYLRARLQRALGVEDPAEIARLALRRRARVHLTEGHLDVSLSLADLPIEVRVAGLDRDPGWVPAAGRYVAFHFD